MRPACLRVCLCVYLDVFLTCLFFLADFRFSQKIHCRRATQVCCASSRLYVQDTIYDAFVKRCVEEAEKRTIGAPTTGSVQGPQVDDIQFKTVMGYIEKGKAEGATCLTGGERHGETGYYVKPTVFSDVTDDMTIAREEIFG